MQPFLWEHDWLFPTPCCGGDFSHILPRVFVARGTQVEKIIPELKFLVHFKIIFLLLFSKPDIPNTNNLIPLFSYLNIIFLRCYFMFLDIFTLN